MKNRHNHRQRLGLLLVGLLTVLLALPVAAQEPGARLRPEQALLELGAGQLEVLNLVLENAGDVYGIDLRASFDPAVVEVVDADLAREGVQFFSEPFLKPDFLVRNIVDNEAGTLQYVMTQVNPTEPASGSGAVISLLLRGKAEGARGAFTIDSVQIADRRGNTLPISFQGGELLVVAPKATVSPAVTAALARIGGAPAPTSPIQPAPASNGAPAGTIAQPVAGDLTLVRIEPALLELQPGEEQQVTVAFADARAVYGVELRMLFDPNLVEVLDSDQDQVGLQAGVASWLTGGFVAVNRIDNAAGTLDFAATLLNPAEPVDGSRPIISLILRGKAAGAGELNLDRALLANRDGEQLAVRLQGSRLVVGSGPLNQPNRPADLPAATLATESDPLLLLAAGAGLAIALIGLSQLFFGRWWRRRTRSS